MHIDIILWIILFFDVDFLANDVIFSSRNFDTQINVLYKFNYIIFMLYAWSILYVRLLWMDYYNKGKIHAYSIDLEIVILERKYALRFVCYACIQILLYLTINRWYINMTKHLLFLKICNTFMMNFKVPMLIDIIHWLSLSL